MAAVQCVEAMAAVLASLDDNENNVYAQLEPFLRPVLHRVFDESGEFLEYFENGIEVVSYLTYHGSTPFSDELWSLFDQMIRAFHGFACDSVWKSTSVSGALGRAARNRHRHAIEQASRRWRGGRRGNSGRTRREL